MTLDKKLTEYKKIKVPKRNATKTIPTFCGVVLRAGTDWIFKHYITVLVQLKGILDFTEDEAQYQGSLNEK